MKYFHKAVSLYMNAYKNKESEETLEILAEDVLSEVEDTLFPSKQEIEKMSKLKIKLRHDKGDAETVVDKRKKKESNTSRPISKKWSLSDVAILQENWRRFCQKYDVDNPFWFLNLKQCNIRIDKKNLDRFKMYISYGIKNWSINSVYLKWTSVECTSATGQITEAEMSLARKLARRNREEDVRDILMLALQRKRKSIMKKLSQCDKTDHVTTYWTMAKEEKLVTLLVEEMEAKELGDLSQPIAYWHWTAVAKELCLKKSQVYNHWHYHIQPALMVNKWLSRSELQIKLIKWLRNLLKKGKVDEWQQVDWTDIGNRLGGLSSLYIYRQIVTLRWNHVNSKKDRDDIHESVKILWEKAVPSIKERGEKGKNQYLRRLSYDWTSKTLIELRPNF